MSSNRKSSDRKNLDKAAKILTEEARRWLRQIGSPDFMQDVVHNLVEDMRSEMTLQLELDDATRPLVDVCQCPGHLGRLYSRKK
jgi:hypothetical protein